MKRVLVLLVLATAACEETPVTATTTTPPPAPCVPTTCAAHGKNCGALPDGCGAVLNCGACDAPLSCAGAGVPNVCGCTPDSDSEVCATLGLECDTAAATDNCGLPRVVSCGACQSPETCGGAQVRNVCGCTAETDLSLCSRLGLECDSAAATDNCGLPRVIACGGCNQPESCGALAANHCDCAPESDSDFCARQGKDCDLFAGADNCGTVRTAACGSCTGAGKVCGGGGWNVCAVPVSGSAVGTYVHDGGETSEVFDFSGTTVAALVEGDGGSFTIYPGTGGPSGWSIPRVPPGPYYLRFGTDSFFVFTERTVDWDFQVAGRIDAVAAASADTGFAAFLTGLSPWDALSDSLGLFCSNNGATEPNLPWISYDAPADGDTQYAGDLLWAYASTPNLIEGDKGDSVYITQMVTRELDGQPYQALGRMLQPALFTMQEGYGIPLVGQLAPVAQSESATFDWRRSSFAGYASTVNPSATPNLQYVGVWAEPTDLRYGWLYDAPGLFLASSMQTSDRVFGPVQYGNPFPSSWSALGFVKAYFAKTYQTASGTPSSFYVSINHYTRAAEMIAAPILPLVSPPRGPRFGNRDAYNDLTGVTLTPTLAWTVPARGSPERYVIEIYRLGVNSSGATSADYIAQIFTSATRIRIPAGILAAGQSYFANITAIEYGTGVDVSKKILPIPRMPYGQATLLTGTFAP